MIKLACAGFFAGVCLPGFGIMFVCFWDYSYMIQKFIWE